jgi:uncharacterized membrane protein
VIERLLPGAGHLQNLHPLVVHFPIGFLIGAAVLYLASAAIQRESVVWAALWMLVFAAAGMAAAVATGLYAYDGVMVAPSVREALLDHHRNLMIAVSALTGILALWAIVRRPMPRRGRWLFVAGLTVACLLMAWGADYGGRMVYDYNAGGDACGQPIDFSK